MLIDSSLPGAMALHSRSSSQDQEQPTRLSQQPAAQPVLEVVEHAPPSLADVRIVVRPEPPQLVETPAGAQPIAHGTPQPRASWGVRLCDAAPDICVCICLTPILVVAATVGSVIECFKCFGCHDGQDRFITWGDICSGVRGWARAR